MNRLLIGCVIMALVCGCGLRSEPETKEKKQVALPVQDRPTVSKQDGLQIAAQLIREGKVTDAIRFLDQAIMEDPANVQAYILLGQTYMHLNEFDRSVDSFRAALRVAPDMGEIYYMLAIVNGLRGRKDLAVTNAEKALLLFQKDQDDNNFKRALVLLQGLSQE